MQTFQATNHTTNHATGTGQDSSFQIDFDKKKLTALALRCEATHQRLHLWLNHPLIQLGLEQSIHEKVIVSKKSMDLIVAFSRWQKTLPRPGLSELYQTILLAYYLKDFGVMGQQLRAQGFETVADELLRFYTQEKTLEDCSQQHWFELFFKSWESALIFLEKKIQGFCFESCFKAQAITLLEDKKINQRQYELLTQLHKEPKMRDKKSLSYSLWFRALYKGLTKRTQERDFNLICEYGFVQMKGKNEFVVMG
jgi:hypothetical protein